jgi:arylformamidase
MIADAIAAGHPDVSGPALEAQYFMRGAVPAWAAYMADWDRTSTLARADFPHRRDLPYGESPAEKLDIILPAGAISNAPVQILIHGGYWRALSKDGFTFPAAPLAAAGVISVCVDYALCPRVSMTELTEQCRRAVRWTRANIAGYGGDPDNLHCTGHSAGAQLSAMLALTPELAPFIRTVTAVSGIYDLAPLRDCSMQADLRLTPADVTALSPLRQPTPTGAAWLIAVGGAETAAFRWQSRAFHEHCVSQGVSAQFLEIPGENHYSVISVLGHANTALQTAWLNLTTRGSPA